MELTLGQICSLYATDKNILHCYVDRVYEDLFRDIRASAENVLEIGLERGASVLMWRDYFTKATITGINDKPCPQLEGRERVRLVVGDAYSYEIADSVPGGFDVIIDDGPHTLESMTFVIKEYLGKLAKGGMLVIEDIQDFNWTNILRRMVPDGHAVDVRDLRTVRNRYDDIIMIVLRS